MSSLTAFPSSDGRGFGKEEHNHVMHLHHTFKVLKVIHQLCTAAGDRSFTFQDTFNNIEACIQYANHCSKAATGPTVTGGHKQPTGAATGPVDVEWPHGHVLALRCSGHCHVPEWLGGEEN